MPELIKRENAPNEQLEGHPPAHFDGGIAINGKEPGNLLKDNTLAVYTNAHCGSASTGVVVDDTEVKIKP